MAHTLEEPLTFFYKSTTFNSRVRDSFLLLRLVPNTHHRCGAMSLWEEQIPCEELISKTCFVICFFYVRFPPLRIAFT